VRRTLICLVLVLTLALSGREVVCSTDNGRPVSAPTPSLEGGRMTRKLPAPKTHSDVSLEESLIKRRSLRDYSDAALTLAELSQLLWAAQGITAPRGGRTVPSAGALYPLEVLVIVGNVQDLAAGVYRYDPKGHELIMVAEGDKRAQLAGAALGQSSVNDGAVDLVLTAVYRRTTGKYGDRGIRYVYMEAGHAAQSVCLQATAMGLGTVPIGAFGDEQVSSLLNLPKDEVPLYIIPVGKRR
jgi:SagB-type dehydrogenase family enzyme